MEQIYSIPINEAFEASVADPSAGCPLCRLHKMLEDNEIELICGASMMEPDIRKKTNESGFCIEHYRKMFARSKKLPLALILQSHLEAVAEKMASPGLIPAVSGRSVTKKLSDVGSTCYVCDRLNSNFKALLSNVVYLWFSDSGFRRLFSLQPHFCLRHYPQLLAVAKDELRPKDFSSFYRAVSAVEEKHINSLKCNIDAFVASFDYRSEGSLNADEKSAIETAIASLTADRI